MTFSIRLFAAVACTLMLAGCGSATAPSTKAQSPTVSQTTSAPKTSPAAHDDDGHGHEHGTALSAEDQKLADLQKLCPVSDEELGGMGPPVKLIVKGQPVFICCKGCEESINDEPDKYLAKVAELKKANK
jgi:hypothetical protein